MYKVLWFCCCNTVGKSAIVAALQLCLGATAKNTDRGSNLGGLIREGSDGPAVMRVTLQNEGQDAYNPDLYGQRIHIERRIHKAGRSEYRICSQQGEVRPPALLILSPCNIFTVSSSMVLHRSFPQRKGN